MLGSLHMMNRLKTYHVWSISDKAQVSCEVWSNFFADILAHLEETDEKGDERICTMLTLAPVSDCLLCVLQ